MNRQQLIDSKQAFKYHSFYRGLNSHNTNDCLSNFYPARFELKTKDKTYKFTCSEQFFMWYKALTFKNFDVANEILAIGYNPKKYKSLGRQVKNYDDNVWNSKREQVMATAIRLKFEQNINMRNYLINTNDEILVECNPYDKIWACGLSNKQSFNRPNTWRGDNKLGFLLMNLRESLKNEN